MANKHTPGPWYVPNDGDGHKVFKDVGDFAHMVAHCGSWSEETIANARLIAAAPELLEVAQNILADDLLPYLPTEYIAKVSAAIAKATGR